MKLPCGSEVPVPCLFCCCCFFRPCCRTALVLLWITVLTNLVLYYKGNQRPASACAAHRSAVITLVFCLCCILLSCFHVVYYACLHRSCKHSFF
jgi:hypothetical protein